MALAAAFASVVGGQIAAQRISMESAALTWTLAEADAGTRL